MNRKTMVAASVLALVFGSVIYVNASDKEQSRESVPSLQQEKIALLEDIVSRYRFGHSEGMPILEELLDAEQDLLLTKIEVASAIEERIKLHQLVVENRERLVEVRNAGLRLGRMDEVDILNARVWLVDAKIALENARVFADR